VREIAQEEIDLGHGPTTIGFKLSTLFEIGIGEKLLAELGCIWELYVPLWCSNSGHGIDVARDLRE